MLTAATLNPHVLSLLARVRHTNRLVIADRGFPCWPQLETIDLSLVDDVPTVCQVLAVLKSNFQVGRAWMATQFQQANDEARQQQFAELLAPVTIEFEDHDQFKTRVPGAIGLIRTGDTTQYGNVILESV